MKYALVKIDVNKDMRDIRFDRVLDVRVFGDIKGIGNIEKYTSSSDFKDNDEVWLLSVLAENGYYLRLKESSHWNNILTIKYHLYKD